MTVYPRAKFRFRLEIDGLEAGKFSEVSGFDAAVEPIEYREGDMAAGTPMKVAGLRKYGTITLKNGVIEGKDVYGWMEKGTAGEVERKTVTVSLLDEMQNVAAVWKITNAWPAKYSVPDFNADSCEIAVESLELAHEGLVRES
ncbi:phage tail protein [[Clostridium] symbiosum]|uniref:phage tail protein n=1 Tax=Clostridium symbiosum TaxID=1512 RepID=UPI001D066A03|nr:phage tail protein [[Clostridium] symbiosum]MCB6608864.1 phage tail protein [[Clostridium] symbiosum]MCB6930209.1 phage tail protein [[Clostridium] symbiosum]